METVCDTSALQDFTSYVTGNSWEGPGSLHCDISKHNNYFYFIVDAINIWWQAPKTSEINTIATQHYTQGTQPAVKSQLL
jgi:hypothetical protein